MVTRSDTSRLLSVGEYSCNVREGPYKTTALLVHVLSTADVGSANDVGVHSLKPVCSTQFETRLQCRLLDLLHMFGLLAQTVMFRLET